MEDLTGCQIPCVPKIAGGKAEFEPQPLIKRLKRALARPWNYYVKNYLKRALNFFKGWYDRLRHKDNAIPLAVEKLSVIHLKFGDRVRVRSLEEIQATLNTFRELNGCAFLEYMKQYCCTEQQVLKVMERFLDERDYQVKKARGIVLLEGVYCQGTPVFGRCDRSCLLFWREEWLEKIPELSVINS